MAENCSVKMRCCTMLLCFLFFNMFTGTTCEAPFGTVAGYDVEGGTEPICWNTVYPNKSSAFDSVEMATQVDSTFDDLNVILYKDGINKNTSLRERCYNQTRLEVSIDNPPAGDFLTDTAYTFRLQVEIDPKEIGTSGEIVPGNEMCWFRLVLCDAVRAGFCSPLYDTIETESQLVSTDTDSEDNGHLESQTSSDDESSGKYNYSRNTTLLGVEQQEHIFSRYVRWHLERADDGSGRLEATVDIDFKLPLGQAGAYFFIGHAILYVTTQDYPDSLIRVDISDAVPNNVIDYVEPPNIQEISTEFKISMGVVLGVAMVLEFWLFAFIVYHRKHKVMKLAQAPFLATFMGSSMFTTASSGLLLWATSDVSCALSGPLILIPMTVMAAILVGRLWRAYSTLAVAFSFGKNRTSKSRGENLMRLLAFLADWRPSHCCRCLQRKRVLRRRSTNATLRTVVTDGDLARLIVILTLPQIVLQTASSLLATRSLEIQLSGNGVTGKETCGGGNWWVSLLGILYIGILFLFVIVAAYMSRGLPSVFNEKSAIFKASAVSGVITFLGVALLFITDDPGTSPNVTVFVWYAMILGVVGALSWHVVMPKVRRVRSGEKVVMTSLFAPSTDGKVCDLSSASNNSLQARFAANRHRQAAKDREDTCERPEQPVDQTTDPPLSSLTFDVEHFGVNEDTRAIVLNEDDPPPRKIEKQVFQASELISTFTAMSLEGRQIPLKDWRELQGAVSELNFQLNRLEFSWTEEDE